MRKSVKKNSWVTVAVCTGFVVLNKESVIVSKLKLSVAKFFASTHTAKEHRLSTTCPARNSRLCLATLVDDPRLLIQIMDISATSLA